MVRVHPGLSEVRRLSGEGAVLIRQISVVRIHPGLSLHGSSMAERPAVNRGAVGSTPTRAVKGQAGGREAEKYPGIFESVV